MQAATYSIMVLAGEQREARRGLERLEQYLETCIQQIDHAKAPLWIETAFTVIVALHRLHEGRKIEQLLIPEIRRITSGNLELLTRLDSARACTGRILTAICRQMERSASGGESDIPTLVATMQLYCSLMLERHTLEDTELIKVARELLPTDLWFEIAAQSMSPVDKRTKTTAVAFSPDIHHSSKQKQPYLH